MYTDGHAVVYCEGAFASTYGKTAHGLVRYTQRYNLIAVIDSSLAGWDSGEFLDSAPNGIPIVSSLDEAFQTANDQEAELSYYVLGIATDGGYLTPHIRSAVIEALESGLNIDSGLHDFLSDDHEIRQLAECYGLGIRDIRKPDRHSNHMFTGKIEEVEAIRVALLGTDSAIGKRTTARIIVNSMADRGLQTEFIGTGQTAWMQGADYSLVMDSLLNDYVSGELEHIVWKAWNEKKMDYAIIEGQGSLMNPGYPGGFEILAACRPHGIILQHAPSRKEYDGFPGYPMDSVEDQIHAIEFLSKKPVIAITINHEGLHPQRIEEECLELEGKLGIPVVDPLVDGVDRIIPVIEELKDEN